MLLHLAFERAWAWLQPRPRVQDETQDLDSWQKGVGPAQASAFKIGSKEVWPSTDRIFF